MERSAPTFASLDLETAGGGDGSAGSSGLVGAEGGLSGRNVIALGPPEEMINHAVGARGGDGGRGGRGGDSAGGSSVGVWIVDGTATLTDVTFDLGPAGSAPLGSVAPAGIQAETYSIQAGIPSP